MMQLQVSLYRFVVVVTLRNQYSCSRRIAAKERTFHILLSDGRKYIDVYTLLSANEANEECECERKESK
jgi:hypothetical protein